jgi:Tol biopolymer transport system component
LSRRLETPITEKTGIQIFPTVSPSGEQLIFESITTETKVHNGLLKIESLSDTGNGVKLSGDAAFPRWSPDGKKIAFIRKSNYTPDIWMMSVNGQDETQLTKGGILERGWFQVPFNTLGNFYDWSPDGQSLAYAAKRNGFYNILTIGTGGASEIARTQNTDQKLLIYSPFFSPDGKRLVYLSENTVEKGENRFSVEIAESGNTKTVFTGGPAVQLCGWKNAPESSAFVAVKKGEEVDLYKISTDSGKQPKAIARLAAANLYSVKISPDGKQFVFTARRDGSDNIFLGAEDKEPVQLTANIDPYIFYAGLEWSPDGKKLFYSRQTGGRQISMITNSK